MEKSPDAFRTISEVAETLDTPAHVLRFWESRFPQIRPVKRAGGRRYYRPTDVALLAGIKRLLHSEGLTIRGVQKMLREQGVRHVIALGDPTTDLTGEFGIPEERDAIPALQDRGAVAAPSVAERQRAAEQDDAVPAPRVVETGDASPTREAPKAMPGTRLQTPAARLRALPAGSLDSSHAALVELLRRMSALRERLSRG